MDEQASSVRLQVAAAKPQDVGKGTARLAIQNLRIREGDVVELVGKRSTAAIALRLYPEDEGLEIVRLDGLQRANADVSIGDHVEIRPADAKPARRVVLAPAQRNLRLSGSGEARPSSAARCSRGTSSRLPSINEPSAVPSAATSPRTSSGRSLPSPPSPSRRSGCASCRCRLAASCA